MLERQIQVPLLLVRLPEPGVRLRKIRPEPKAVLELHKER
jgi:hypothetical protein